MVSYGVSICCSATEKRPSNMSPLPQFPHPHHSSELRKWIAGEFAYRRYSQESTLMNQSLENCYYEN